MMFSLNAFAAFTILLSFTSFVSATDYRLLVNKPSCQTMDQFKFKWVLAISVHWITSLSPPQLGYVWLRFSVPHPTGFSFETLCPVFDTSNTTVYNGGLYFRPGNYQGQNTDSMSFTRFDRKELTVMVHTWLIVAQALVFCVSLIISASQLIWCGKLVDSRSIRHTSTAPIIAFTLSPLSSLPPSADRPPEGAIIHRRSNAVRTYYK